MQGNSSQTSETLEIAQNADRSGVGPVFLAMPYLIAIAWVALLFYSNIVGEPFNVSAEDGLLEWATCVFFVVGGVLAWLATSRVTDRRQRIFLIIFGIVCLLAVGEELSWGQRLFGFGPPKLSEKSALKIGHGDAAVHNLTIKTRYFQFSIGGALFGIVLLGGLVWHGIWVPLAMKRNAPRTQWIVRKLGLFVPPLDLGILVSVLVALVIRRRFFRNTESNEFKEFIVPVIYCYILARVFFASSARRDRAVRIALVLITIGWLGGSTLYFTMR